MLQSYLFWLMLCHEGLCPEEPPVIIHIKQNNPADVLITVYTSTYLLSAHRDLESFTHTPKDNHNLDLPLQLTCTTLDCVRKSSDYAENTTQTRCGGLDSRCYTASYGGPFSDVSEFVCLWRVAVGTQNQQKSGLPSRCSARPNEQAENPCNSASPAHVQ